MRVAILAQFPIHILPEFSYLGEPKQHYATWLPQLAQGFGVAIANGEWRMANGSLRRLKEVEDSGFRIENSEDAPVITPPRASSPPLTPESLIQNQDPLEIHWITLSTEVSEPRVVEYLNQTFHILPTTTSGRASSLFREDRRNIQASIDRINPDLVHGWGNEDVYGLAAVLSGRRNMVSVQGLLSYCVLRNRYPNRTYFQALLELFVLNRADALVCESKWACDMVRRRLLNRNKRIHHVEYGVQGFIFVKKWQPNLSKPIAIFTGSVAPSKGIQDVVNAFRHPNLCNSELWVLGADNTPFARKLKKNAPPNIKWFGRLGIQECIEHLSQGWCFVLPTRGDTGPMAVKEAMVVGLPVVSSPNSGARDYIRDGENGFLVPCARPDILAERLECLLKDYEVCRAMGAARHEEAREHFRPERTADKFVRIYRDGFQK